MVLIDLISIVIPSYNRVEHVLACIASVFKNTIYPNYELIVIIDGDTTKNRVIAQILNFLQVRFRLQYTNEGCTATLNAGFRLAHGKYVVWIADDYLVPEGWLTKLYNCYMHNQDVENPVRLVGLCKPAVADADKAKCDGRYYAENFFFEKSFMESIGYLDTCFRSYYLDVNLAHEVYDMGYDVVPCLDFCVAETDPTPQAAGEPEAHKTKLEIHGVDMNSLKMLYRQKWFWPDIHKNVPFAEYPVLKPRSQPIMNPKWIKNRGLS